MLKIFGMSTSLNKKSFVYFMILLGVGRCADKVLFLKETNLRLKGSVLKTVHAKDQFECIVFCSKESSCVSVNFKHTGLDQESCELNSKTFNESEPKKCLKHPQYNYLEMVEKVRTVYTESVRNIRFMQD